jgi:hypothetical protein
MSTTEILTSNVCSFARVDEQQPARLLPPVPAFPTAGGPSTAGVPDGAPLMDPGNYTRDFSFLDETATGYLHAASTIRIVTDTEVPGQRLADELPKRIGYAACPGVSTLEGGKDANAILVNLGAPVVRDALAGGKSYLMLALPAHGTRPIATLPPSRGRRPIIGLAPVEASHAR